MEQAVNTFTRGLQSDTHPMIQGTDVMTDCLNGTLVTMNGNEVILQNDMGNRRVDNAFLPSGYQPVGMKEYGGIIYVAAYNPITNKSQIGSFPSPQKKINSLNNDELGGRFNFDQFFSSGNIYEDSDLGKIKVLNSDSFMIPLTKDTSLRAGDKFVVSSAELKNYSQDISNYNNTIEVYGVKYILSPKNKRYTLQLGILNSQNEFVDITKTLQRWDDNKNESTPKSYDSTFSDLYKFNDGYFIAYNYDNKNFEVTENDKKFIINRQKIPANTYSYKLIGPLYLKVNLNHIQNFNYNVYGVKGDENEGTSTEIYIEGFLTYNCPDGIEDLKGNSIGEYLYSGEDIINKNNFYSFDLYQLSNNTVSRKLSESINEDTDNENIEKSSNVYNIESNQYSVKIVKKYDIGKKYTGMFNYVLGVNADTQCDNQTYIKGLSSKGSINIDLLGSGKLQFNGWKFYNNLNDRNTTLTFSFEAYPKYGQEFNNLRFVFININENDNEEDHYFPKKDDIALPLYNGRQTYTFNWDDIGLNPRKVYRVITQYQILNKSTKKIIKEEDKEIIEIDDNRWLLTTELFNEFYPSSSGISDFSITRNQEFLDKMKVGVDIDTDLIDSSYLDNGVLEGSLISTKKNNDNWNYKDNDIEFKCKHTLNLNIKSNSNLEISKKDLYPDFITISGKAQISSCKTYLDNDELTNENFKSKLEYYKKGEIQQDNNYIEKNINIDSNNNTVIGNITYYDIFNGKSDDNSYIKEITNGFDSINSIKDKLFPKVFGGVLEEEFEDDDKKIYSYVGNYIAIKKIDDNFPSGKYIYNEKTIYELNRHFYHEGINEKVFDYWNKRVPRGQCFLFVFGTMHQGINTDISTNQNFGGSTVSTNFLDNKILRSFPHGFAQFWYRTTDDLWAFGGVLPFTSDGNIWYGFDEGDAPGDCHTVYFNSSKQGKTMTKISITDNVLNYDSLEDSLRTVLKKSFLNKIKNIYKSEIVYCVYDSYIYNEQSDNKLWYSSVYKYNNYYNVPIKLTVNFQNNKFISGIDKYIGNLQFIDNHNNVDIQKSINYNLTSSQNFFDYINNFDYNDISNIHIKNGTMFDSNGIRLNGLKLYEYKNEDEKVLSSRKDQSEFTILHEDYEGINTLLYNKNKIGTYPHASAIRLRAGFSLNLDLSNVLIIDDGIDIKNDL